MKMRFLHSILCIFVVGSVLAVGTHDQPSKPTTGPQPGNSDPNALPAAPSGAGSSVQSPQTVSQGQTGVDGSAGEGQQNKAKGQPGVAGSAVQSSQTQSESQTVATVTVGEGQQGQSQHQDEEAVKKVLTPKDTPQNTLPNSSGTTSSTSAQSVHTEVQAGDPSPAAAPTEENPELKQGKVLPEQTSAPAELRKAEGAQSPVNGPSADLKEDEEEKEEEKEKGDEEEDGKTTTQETETQSGKAPVLKPESQAPEGQRGTNGQSDPDSVAANHEKTPKEPAPTTPPGEGKSQLSDQTEQVPKSDLSVQPTTVNSADGAPGREDHSVSQPGPAEPTAPALADANPKQENQVPKVDVKKPVAVENPQDHAKPSDSEDEEEEEEEEDDGEEEDDEIFGEYHATDEIPEEVRRNYGRSRNGSPNGETRRDAVRPGSERTHTRNRRQSGSGSSSSGTQTDANSAGTQQPGKAGEDVSQQGPQRESSNSQAPQQSTLETLVRTGSISEKQEIVTAFLKKDLADGPLRKIFNYDNSKTLETCRHLTQRKPKVCKAGNIKTEAPSANVDLNRLVGEYLTHSVCTVEAALNQMYHSVHQGEYISNEIHTALKILSNVMRMNTTMRERYGDSEHILENLLQLFHAAEKALVSQSVQTVLYNRWALLDSVLCAVASGESNEVLDKINMDASNSSATAVVNLERFINSSTEVFVKAYKPFAELLRVIENGVLIKALELNKNEFREQAERVVQTITERHVSGISPATLTPLAQIPHSGMNTADIQRIAGQMGNSVSLVQRGQDVTQAGAVSPTTALRTAVLSLNIFKVSGNHIAPEIDESAVRTMVRSALLSFSEEEMVSKLIVAPQAALRVIYETIKLLVPIPAENGATAVTSDDANSRIKEIERLMDENFRQVNQAVSRSLSTSGRANPPETALIQTAVNHLGGAAPAKTDLQTRATFTVDSRQDGANLEDNTNKYIEEQQFQKNMDNLVHIKSYSSATLAGTVGILALALVVIF